MSWTPGDQGRFRPLEKAAWLRHCSRAGLSPSDKSARDQWYRAELQKATGHTSTKALDRGRHLDKACAHFEALGDSGIDNQLRLIQGDLRRIRYAANQVNPAWSGQFPREADLERFLRSIVLQAFREPLELHELTDAQIRTVTQIVRVDANRFQKA